MSTDAASRQRTLDPAEHHRYARQILRTEGEALLSLAEGLDRGLFARAIELLFHCAGSVIVTGMGKAGLIGQKITATLASTGTRSHFLHPSEALHGDLGRIHQQDVALVLSQSGETEEVVRLLPSLERLAASVIAITGKPTSTLGRAAEVTLDLGSITEAGSLGLAPSTSTTNMLALGDALALVTSRLRRFGPEDFARFHPGGSLGRKLAKTEEVMRPLSDCRVADERSTVREVFVRVSRPGRRTGAIMLTGAGGVLTGLFTDSDLARLFEAGRTDSLDRPIRRVMTASPATVRRGTLMSEAVDMLADKKISELPVVDGEGKPVGLIDVTDMVGLQPEQEPPVQSENPIAAPSQSLKLTKLAMSRTLPFPNRRRPGA